MRDLCEMDASDLMNGGRGDLARLEAEAFPDTVPEELTDQLVLTDFGRDRDLGRLGTGREGEGWGRPLRVRGPVPKRRSRIGACAERVRFPIPGLDGNGGVLKMDPLCFGIGMTIGDVSRDGGGGEEEVSKLIWR